MSKHAYRERIANHVLGCLRERLAAHEPEDGVFTVSFGKRESQGGFNDFVVEDGVVRFFYHDPTARDQRSVAMIVPKHRIRHVFFERDAARSPLV